MSDLEFRVLGTAELRRDGCLIAVRPGPSLNLLAGLLMSANEVVTADAAAEYAWGPRPPAYPRAALHNHVSRLRKLLGEDVIETAGSGYRLRASAGQLDLLKFNELLASVSESVPDSDAMVTLDGALELWRGTPLSNVPSPALHHEAVPRLVERYLAACELWAEVSMRMHRPGLVAERLAPLAAAHPFRESLAAQLMLARHRAGRSADALAGYETLRTTLRDELGVDPGKPVHDLYLSVLRDTTLNSEPPAAGSWQPRWTGRGPAPGGLIGRESDQRALAESLKEHAAVTVTGTAGVGKTELALQTAGRLAGDFADGVVVAELGTLPAQPTSDLQTLCGMVLRMLGAPPVPGRAGLEELIDWLRPRELLLVLDNAEHVSMACSQLADWITRACPAVQVITTSRRQLGFAGERVITLSRLGQADAQRLLLRAAAERGSDRELRRDQAGLARLCEQLDGIPLALELAAAKLRTMSLTALTERITAQAGLLSVDSRPGLPHQRGLFTTLRWSYDLLSEPCQQLLQRLTVFAGTFTLADAEQVCGGPPFTESAVAGHLSSLAEDSLVHFTDDHGYRLLVPIREFAAAQARPRGLDATRTAHLRHFCAAADSIERCGNSDRQDAIGQLERVYHEITAALEWALRAEAPAVEAERGIRLLLAARPVWERRHGAILGARDFAERALPRAPATSPALASELLFTAGHIRYWTGSMAAAKPLLEQVRELDAEEPGRHARSAAALSTLAAIAYAGVEPEAAELIRESAAEARKTRTGDGTSFLLGIAAQMLAALGHLGEALDLIGEADREAGNDPRLRLRYLVRRAVVCVRANRLGEAMTNLEAVLAEAPEISSNDLGIALLARGHVLARQGRLAAARDTVTEGLNLAQHRAPILLPDMNQLFAVIEVASGDLARAAQHVREVLEWAVRHSSVIDAFGALHVAVVLAARLGSPQAGQLATAVRGLRHATGLPTWPFTSPAYVRYEEKAGVDDAVDARPLNPGTLASARDLALASLAPL